MLNDSIPFKTVDLCCEGFVDFHDLKDLSVGIAWPKNVVT